VIPSQQEALEWLAEWNRGKERGQEPVIEKIHINLREKQRMDNIREVYQSNTRQVQNRTLSQLRKITEPQPFSDDEYSATTGQGLLVRENGRRDKMLDRPDGAKTAGPVRWIDTDRNDVDPNEASVSSLPIDPNSPKALFYRELARMGYGRNRSQ
jgi:hypothetical protein